MQRSTVCSTCCMLALVYTLQALCMVRDMHRGVDGRMRALSQMKRLSLCGELLGTLHHEAEDA
jgi:hypothetical protein